MDADLLPQPDIESDSPEIKAKAMEIKQGAGRRDVYRIFKSIPSMLSFPKGSRIGEKSQSALQAMRTGEGVCGHFANLMTALCRASGIPARSISGLALQNLPPFWPARTKTWLHPGVAHAWVEFYTGEKGWEMADPTNAVISPLAWLWFGRNDGAHLSYGEKERGKEIYEQVRAWAAGKGQIISAMDAPNKFVTAAGTKTVKITPRVTVKTEWGGFWIKTIISVALAWIAVFLLKRRLKKYLITKQG